MDSHSFILPTFFIVGAQKCGTTSLYAHLKKHPQVFLPELKEPEYFAALPPAPAEMVGPTLRARTMEDYQGLYSGARGFTAIGDVTPTYLWDPESPGLIHEACPQARIIIILRDPVIRAHSAYLMNLGRDYDSAPSFRKALDMDRKRDKSHWYSAWHYEDAGLYYAGVRRYLETFGAEQVLILSFEDLIGNPLQLFTAVGHHIGIDVNYFASVDLTEPHNTFKMPRHMTAYRIAGVLGFRSWLLSPSVRTRLNHNPLLFERKNKPALDPESRQQLQETYEPDISQLEDLLERKLPDLRKSWAQQEARSRL